MIRVQVMKLVGISTWHGLVDDEVREGQILKSNGLIKAWAIQEKKFSKAGKKKREGREKEERLEVR